MPARRVLDVGQCDFDHSRISHILKANFDLKALKSNEGTSSIPVMLVSNYDDAQTEAVAAGAEHGFGKANLDSEATMEKLGKFLAAV